MITYFYLLTCRCSPTNIHVHDYVPVYAIYLLPNQIYFISIICQVNIHLQMSGKYSSTSTLLCLV